MAWNLSGLFPKQFDFFGPAEVLRALITLDADGDGALQIGEVRLATARTDTATCGAGGKRRSLEPDPAKST